MERASLPIFRRPMSRLSIEVPDSLQRALEHRAATDAHSVEDVVLSLLGSALGVTPSRSLPPPPRIEAAADILSDEALALAIRETSAFHEGG